MYSRFTNPTVDAFQNKLAALEGAEKCQATASGMAAIFATIMTILKPGEHMVASRCMFGTTIVLLNNIIEKFDIKVTFVDLPDLKSWESSVQENTKLFLLEGRLRFWSWVIAFGWKKNVPTLVWYND